MECFFARLIILLPAGVNGGGKGRGADQKNNTLLRVQHCCKGGKKRGGRKERTATKRSKISLLHPRTSLSCRRGGVAVVISRE